MGYEQMIQAIESLGGKVEIFMIKPGEWCASCRPLEISNGKMLGSVLGHGCAPIDSVVALWQRLTTYKGRERVVVDAFGNKRRAVRWNGFMWADYPETKGA